MTYEVRDEADNAAFCNFNVFVQCKYNIVIQIKWKKKVSVLGLSVEFETKFAKNKDFSLKMNILVVKKTVFVEIIILLIDMNLFIIIPNTPVYCLKFCFSIL